MASNQFETDKYRIVFFSADGGKGISILDSAREILWCLYQYRIWMMLGYNSLRAGLLRSRLGLLWVPLSLGFIVALYGTLFSGVFNISAEQYVPYLASGWVGWRLISGFFSQMSLVYETNRVFIGNLNFPIPMYIFAKIFQLTVEFALHSLVLMTTMVIFKTPVTPTILLLPLVLFMFALCASGIAYSIGLLSARIPDVKNLIPPIAQSLFFITPIIWQASAIQGVRRHLIEWNPFYHAIEVLRNCLNITPFNETSWIVMVSLSGLSLIITVIGHSLYSRRVRLWVA